MTSKRIGGLWLAVLAWTFAPAAYAQLSIDERCANATGGLVLSMQTARETGFAREVALEMAGLAPGGPSYRIADEAYRQLASGIPVATALQRAKARCRQIGVEALEDDERTFETSREPAGRGGDAQLCAVVATSLANYLTDDPANAARPLDDALRDYLLSIPRDGPAPQTRRALQVAQERARVGANAQELQRVVLRHCEALTTAEREALEAEAYVR